MGTQPHQKQHCRTPGAGPLSKLHLCVVWPAIISDHEPPNCQENNGNKATPVSSEVNGNDWFAVPLLLSPWGCLLEAASGNVAVTWENIILHVLVSSMSSSRKHYGCRTAMGKSPEVWQVLESTQKMLDTMCLILLVELDPYINPKSFLHVRCPWPS